MMDEPNELRLLESWSKRAYDRIAPGYNDSSHSTLELFKAIISDFLIASAFPLLAARDRVLLIGGGGGFMVREAISRSVELIVIDISTSMLLTGDAVLAPRVQGSAFSLPFRGAAFDSVFALLGGAFMGRTAINEIHRVLRPNGLLVSAESSRVFADAISAALMTAPDAILMKDKNNTAIKLPFPFRYMVSEFSELLKECEFKVVQAKTIFLGDRRNSTNLIRRAAEALLLEPKQVPLLVASVAKKEVTGNE